MTSSALNAERRASDIAWLADGGMVDVLVVGGGITGVGAALDAAARGLAVALVERGDLAQGTSQMSSKLVHGGLRYVGSGEFGIAWECARERHLLMTRIAPHLVLPAPFVWPLTPSMPLPLAAALRSALAACDVMRVGARTPNRLLPRSRRIGPALTRTLTPAVSADGLRGGLLYWDGLLEDDARLVVAVARTAAAWGARIITRCSADRVGTTTQVTDRVTGESFEISPRSVLNATGVWAQQFDPSVRVRASKGSHLLLRGGALGAPRAAMQLVVPGERGRAVLAVPRPDGLVLVGLTDDEVVGPVPDRVEVTAEDRAFLLRTINLVLDEPVSAADVVGSYAGLRPLVDDGDGSTADLSRRHVLVQRDGEPVISIVGGKLTTYRRMASQAIDQLAAAAGLVAAPSATAGLPLIGAEPLDRSDAPPRLRRSYGGEAAQLHQDPVLREPVVPGSPVTRAEIEHAFSHEGALSVEDVVARRVAGRLSAEVRDVLLDALADDPRHDATPIKERPIRHA
jgi:glycerol-3-phosphate dehydrogenase